MSANRMLFLNLLQADAGTIDEDDLPRDYVLACRFLHCSIIDRTASLDQGFAYTALDRIPEPSMDGATFAELCDVVGAEVVAQAITAGKAIDVLWSGGIDSTTALIAIMKAAEKRGCEDRVHVLMSLDSVHENPGFFLRRIVGTYSVQSVGHPISASLNPARIGVTGEHGDQLFGSRLLESYVRRGLGQASYHDLLPLALVERLRNPIHAYRVYRYLRPVIAAAPVPIRSLFDCLWWLNFSLKWQEVTLRLPVYRGAEARAVYDSLRHFFRDERFQAWALANAQVRQVPVWARYKEVAKQYVFDFTGDRRYYRTKEKEDSLRNVMVAPGATSRYRAFMREDFRPVLTQVEWPPSKGTLR